MSRTQTEQITVSARALRDADLKELASAGYDRVPVVREVLADFETPLSTYLKLADAPFSYLFESVQGGEKWGRYSIIGLPCQTILRVRETTVEVVSHGEVIERHESDDPFTFVAEYKQRFNVAALKDVPQFSGGLVGYFSYDTVRYAEPTLGPSPGSDEIGTPEILLLLSEEVVVFDNLRGTIAMVCHVDPSQSDALALAEKRLDEIEGGLAKPLSLPVIEQDSRESSTQEQDFSSSFQQAPFEAAVDKIKEYILAGDTMQVVPVSYTHLTLPTKRIV